MDRRWFHPSINGAMASILLKKEGKVGSFLVRHSHSSGGFCLSVRMPDDVTHVKINNDGECFDVLGPEGEKFATLSDLVHYYMEGGAGYGLLKEKGCEIRLRYPLPTTDHRTERFFHRDLSGADAEKYLEQSKDGWFLVRPSQTEHGQFVLSVRIKKNFFHFRITCQNGQYSIGDNHNFTSLAQLVNYYRSHDLQDHSGASTTLKQAIDMTNFRVSEIGMRIAQLEKTFIINDDERDGFWEEFEHLQSLEDTQSRRFEHGKMPENRKKNRYKNILPYDDTRVKLKAVNSSVVGSDYINANYVKVNVGRHERTYIAAQGCMQHTIADFWLMVWQENTTIITMLTDLMENGKVKCVQYWPNDSDGVMTLNVYNGRIHVEPLSSRQPARDWILRVFRVWKESSKGKSENARTIYHYHYLEWPDKKIPTASDAVIVLDFIKQINDRWSAEMFVGPMIVHCSAGIGRTGTFIAMDVLQNKIAREGEQCEIDVFETVSNLRRFRPGLVQVWHQYRFIYIAIKRFVENRSTAPEVSASGTELYENFGVLNVASASSSSRSPTLPAYAAAHNRSATLNTASRPWTNPPPALRSHSSDDDVTVRQTNQNLQHVYGNIGQSTNIRSPYSAKSSTLRR